MRAEAQSKLLRVLENRIIRRVGGKVDLPVEVTVIATTNRDLKQAVTDKEFREDLFFRLNTFALHLPPLRDRREDIPLLARYFCDYFSNQYNKKDISGFSAETEKSLNNYNWPGNIRELKNVIERCIVLGNDKIINPEYLPQELKSGTVGTLPFVERRKNARLILPEKGISLDEVEKDLIKQALEKVGNNQTKAAKLLNISYDRVRYQVKKFKLM
jgi:transcriptional regulator with PAS, ATPase and Fis domain